MLGTCLKEVNYHWFSECDSWRPKGARHVLGAFGKMSGIDCRRFLRSSHPLPLLLIFRAPSQFRFLCVIFFRTPSHWKFLETPATQSLSRRFARGRLGQRDVTRRIVVKTLCNWKLKVSEECKLARGEKWPRNLIICSSLCSSNSWTYVKINRNCFMLHSWSFLKTGL